MIRRQSLGILLTILAGFILAGFVGALAAIPIHHISRETKRFVSYFLIPTFLAMVIATIFEGPRDQTLQFASERPIAHTLGLTIAFGIVTTALNGSGAITPEDSDPEPEQSGSSSS